MFKFYDEMPGDQKGLFWIIVIAVIGITTGLILIVKDIIQAFT